MRKTFIDELIKIAEVDERIVLLTGDLGFMVLEPFIEAFPQRYINMGVAEQNMMGVATGLAEAGFIPFVYSIATFASMRAYEFIRNGPVLHGLPVRVVGVGGGYEYSLAGPTHHGLEDVGIMRTNPDIAVFAPADAAQTRTVIQKTWDQPTPIYYRLGKNDNDHLPALNGSFDLERINILQKGARVAVLTTGSIAINVDTAVKELAELGEQVTFAVVPTLNPAPEADIAALAATHQHIVTIEEHYTQGGLGSMVAEIVAGMSTACKLHRCGLQSQLHKSLGSRDYLLAQHKLDKQSITDKLLALLAEK